MVLEGSTKIVEMTLALGPPSRFQHPQARATSLQTIRDLLNARPPFLYHHCKVSSHTTSITVQRSEKRAWNAPPDVDTHPPHPSSHIQF
ncbi:hypothetical protein LMH87_007195 [Akanthomyces muscarius]|uniref:Uncharacterized protein n=1 Tax=Akanthomyces muscarius TaxID=2231603 RepID=A0A9W8QSE7_AKAMU|nr:hypothetical protein LMH87_007195 [Akanthomyces muscarius]KAJ4165567.1 hypothetical protein LMH87_007195 [Akanthomyces muscarius]